MPGKRGYDRKTLLEIVDPIFRKQNAPYYLAHGTVLGIIRDGKPIGDIDIIFNVDASDERLKKVINALKEYGMKLKRKNDRNHFQTKQPYGMCLYFYEDFSDDLKIAYVEKTVSPEGNLFLPSIFFETEASLTLYGQEYSIFHPIEIYFEWMYDDWKTRRKGKFHETAAPNTMYKKEAIKKIEEWKKNGKIDEIKKANNIK